MRILWLNHRGPEHPRAGGAERTILEIGRRLVRNGHELVLVTARWRGGPPTASADGLTVVRVAGLLRLHLAALRLCKVRPRPDVVVEDLAHVVPWGVRAFEEVPVTGFFRHLHARTLGGQLPTVLAEALVRVERSYNRIYRGLPLVVESASSFSDLVGLGIDPRQIVTIPPGVDSVVFQPGERALPPILVYFGGLRSYKRPEEALFLAKRLIAEGIQFTLAIVGEGPMKSRLEHLSENMRLTERIAFLGRLSDERLSALVRSASVNLHFSVAEGWCLSAAEAAASGVPTVGYRVSGLKDSVVDGRTGLLVEDGNRQALFHAVVTILSDPVGWAERCRDHALTLGWEATASAWEKHLQSVATKTQESHDSMSV